LQGYQEALQQAGIPLDPDLIAVGDFTRPTGRSCGRQLLALPQPPTAILAANDQSAIGASEAACEMGLRIPDDLSVIGFDNIPEAVYFNPSLTTVDQFIDKMGYVATEMLIRLIQGESLDNNLCMVRTELVIRDSCRAWSGPLAAHARVLMREDNRMGS
jgi:LacI family transcriptional regulator